ncbi:MAG: hypothetical protein OIF50_14630 [Flavobacteriaceae bacterium]|nr:hypothetical protein [Flavobacteriaceae bacterium]
METLVATILIVLIFMVASLVMNQLFAVYAKKKDFGMRQIQNRYTYKAIHGKLDLPYHSNEGDWVIEIDQSKKHLEGFLRNQKTKKEKRWSLQLNKEE